MNRSFVLPGQMSLIFFKVNIQSFCVQPEFFETVKFPCRFFENMNNHVAVIEQHPVSMAEAFDADRFFPAADESLLNCIGNCPDLGRAFA